MWPDHVTGPALQDRQGGVCAEAGPEKQLLICCGLHTPSTRHLPRSPAPAWGQPPSGAARESRVLGKSGACRKNTRLTASQFLFIYLFIVFFSFFF